MSRPGRSRFLVEHAYSKSTRRVYKKAVSLFLAWCDASGIRDAATTDDLDMVLTEYFHDIYIGGRQVGQGKQRAINTVYGLTMYLPMLRNKLQTAKLALRGWSRLVPVVSYPPLSWDLTVLLAVQMVRHGYVGAGVATLVGFHCLLRIGELVGLRTSDVARLRDHRLGSTRRLQRMGLRLRKTKTGKEQWVDVLDTDVASILGNWCDARKAAGAGRLFGFSATQYRQLLKSLCEQLGLSGRYVPHSLRHGGATRLHMDGWSIEDILLRGRWLSNKSARRYIQSGRALLLSMRIPTDVALIAAYLVKDISLSWTLAQKH